MPTETRAVETLPNVGALARWLAAEMARRGLSQRELARRSGVDHGTISRILTGVTDPAAVTLGTLFALSHGLDPNAD
jgi:transcriptional regulator with XRE-family HTH domain